MAESTVIFDLAALVRPAPTFRDADGSEYPFLAPDDFGFVEMARLQAAEETRTAARARYDADNTDVAAAEEHRAGLRQIMAVILPTLPDDRRERLSDKTMMRRLGRWQETLVVPISAGAATGPAPATTSERSQPTSAATTPATRSKAS